MPFKWKGGVHPDYMKSPSPVKVIAPPKEVTVPMQTHIGAPCQPLVAVGDEVKMGQKIGDNPTAPLCAPIHSPVSGKVIKIEPEERRISISIKEVAPIDPELPEEEAVEEAAEEAPAETTEE